MIATLVSMMLAQAATRAEANVVKGPVLMTQAQIRAYNARLARDDPAYIRCVSTPAIGSLVRKDRSCRTNAEWRRADDRGNDNARETMEAMEGKSWRTSDDTPFKGI